MKNILLLIFLIFTGVVFSQEPSEKLNSVKIFPNPATSVINVLGLENDQMATIIILDTYGTAVLKHNWDIKNNSLNIPIYQLEKGIYMLTIQSAKQQIKRKFYKQ